MLFCIKLLLCSVEFPKWKVRTGILDVYFPRLQMFYSMFFLMSIIESFLKSPSYIFLSLLSFWVEVIWAEFQYFKRSTDSTSRGVVKSAGPRGQLTVQKLKQSWGHFATSSNEGGKVKKAKGFSRLAFWQVDIKRRDSLYLIWDTQNVVHKRIE